MADGQGVGVADDHQFIGFAQAIAAIFGLELGKLEAGLGHLAGFGKGQWQFAGGTVGEFGGEGWHDGLDRLCSVFVLK